MTVRAICYPWHLWRIVADDGHPRGGLCALCGRDIAIEVRQPTDGAVCLYCAVDKGWITEDAPFGDAKQSSTRGPDDPPRDSLKSPSGDGR